MHTNDTYNFIDPCILTYHCYENVTLDCML